MVSGIDHLNYHVWNKQCQNNLQEIPYFSQGGKIQSQKSINLFWGIFTFMGKDCFLSTKQEILLNDPVPTFNCLLHQHIPEIWIPGSQSELTESTILCNVKVCRLATYPRRFLNIQRKDIQLGNSQSSSYYR